MSILLKIPKTEKSHPHIAKKIDMMWDSPEVVAYLEKLLLTDRSELREGFELDVWSELDDLLSHSKFQRVQDEVSKANDTNKDAFRRE